MRLAARLGCTRVGAWAFRLLCLRWEGATAPGPGIMSVWAAVIGGALAAVAAARLLVTTPLAAAAGAAVAVAALLARVSLLPGSLGSARRPAG